MDYVFVNSVSWTMAPVTFKSYKLSVAKLKETTLRSQTLSDSSLSRDCERIHSLGSIFAIAADRKSTESIWFVYIVDVEEVIDEKLDSLRSCYTTMPHVCEEEWGSPIKGKR